MGDAAGKGTCGGLILLALPGAMIRRVADPAPGMVQARGSVPADDGPAGRESIHRALRAKPDEVVGRRGVTVAAVEIRKIRPPRMCRRR